MERTIINSVALFRFALLWALLLLVPACAGCGSGGRHEDDVPLYLENLTPDSMLRIMNRRLLRLGGCDAGLKLSVESSAGKAELEAALIFDAPSRFRVQLFHKGEPPVLDFVLNGRDARFYFPADLKVLETSLDAVLSEPNGLFSLAEAVSFLPGGLEGFRPYGVQMSTGRFVYFRKVGPMECRAFVDRPTLTIRRVLYSTAEKAFFEVSYSDFVTAGEGVWPRLAVLEAEGFHAEIRTLSLAVTGMHSITAFTLDVLPGTETVRSPSEIREDSGWRD